MPLGAAHTSLSLVAGRHRGASSNQTRVLGPHHPVDLDKVRGATGRRAGEPNRNDGIGAQGTVARERGQRGERRDFSSHLGDRKRHLARVAYRDCPGSRAIVRRDGSSTWSRGSAVRRIHGLCTTNDAQGSAICRGVAGRERDGLRPQRECHADDAARLDPLIP